MLDDRGTQKDNSKASSESSGQRLNGDGFPSPRDLGSVDGDATRLGTKTDGQVAVDDEPDIGSQANQVGQFPVTQYGRLCRLCPR